MKLSRRAKDLHGRTRDATRMGDLKKLAKEIKVDHELGLELWSTGDLMTRHLAVLILDKKRMTQELVDQLDADLQAHDSDEQTRLMQWLMANQLAKTKGGKALMLSWEHSESTLQRRTFWYYQARLRWTGQEPPDNTEALLEAIEARMADEEPEVQWAMNFTAGWIGVYQAKHRKRCVKIGKDTGMYADEVVAKNCTPNYLPVFIRIEVAKRAG